MTTADHPDHNVTPITAANGDLKDYFDDPTDGKYDPAAFYTASTDAKRGHHSAYSRVKYPLYVHAAISEFVSSDDWPEIRSEADAFRDGIVHWIVMRKKQVRNPAMRARLQSLINEALVYQRGAERLDRERRQRDRMSLIDQMEREIEDRGVLREALVEMSEQAENLDEPYRTQTLERLEKILTRL